ncbi:MAG: TonB-dependent receptor, partial [Planctomycetota bacterium]
SEEIAESDLDSIGGTLLFDSQLSDNFNLLWGMDIYSESYENDDTDPNIEDTIANLTDPNVVALSPSLARFDEETDRRPDGEQRVIGLFAQSDWDVNEKVKLTGGLRLDFFRQEAFPTELFQACRVPSFGAGEPLVGPDCGSFVMAGPTVAFAPQFEPFSGQEPQVVDFEGNERDDVQLIPNLGVNWAISPQFAVYGTYSRGVQQPSFFDLYGGPQSFGTTIGNPDLKPQESDSFDIGLRYRGDRVSVDMAYFRQYYDGQFLNVGEQEFGSSLIRFIENLNTSVVQGIETEVAWDMSQDWSLFGNFTWTNGFVTSDVPNLDIRDGDRIDQIVPFQIVFGVLYENDRGTFGRLQ